MSTKVLTAHVPTDLADRVDELALRLERSRAWIVKQALADWISREDEKHAMTLEGLADIDAGRLIDHEVIESWIDSLDSDNPLPPPR